MGISQYKDIHWSFFSSFILNIKRFFPACCRCGPCKDTTKDRMFKRGFNKFLKEIEITNMLKSLRIIKSQTKRNFSRIQWRIYKLQHGTRKLHLD